MAANRDIRRCALQALYQFDMVGDESPDVIQASLKASPGDEDEHARGFALAQDAWRSREQVDGLVATLAPDWPTYRQPVIDRNILRLAWHEITAGVTPPKVAINEAVELAREFSTDRSPAFINGVLDRLYKSRREATTQALDESPASAPDDRSPADSEPAPLSPH